MILPFTGSIFLDKPVLIRILEKIRGPIISSKRTEHSLTGLTIPAPKKTRNIKGVIKSPER